MHMDYTQGLLGKPAYIGKFNISARNTPLQDICLTLVCRAALLCLELCLQSGPAASSTFAIETE